MRQRATIVVLHGAWLRRAAFGAPALVTGLTGAAFDAQAPDARGDARGLSAETSVAGSLRRFDLRDDVLGPVGAGRR